MNLQSLSSSFLVTIALILPRALADPATDFLPAAPAGKEWKLAWRDEFDGTTVDETKWNRLGDWKRRDGLWVKDDAYLNGGGQLVLRTRKDGERFTCGAVNTQGKFEHAFGYYVARCKLPSQPGHWPAFWLMSPGVNQVGNDGRDGTEIDIIEIPWRDGRLTSNLHWDGYGKAHKSAGTKFVIPAVTNGFHTFSLLWQPTEYIFYVDGKEVWRSAAGGVSQVPEYIKLTEEIGKWGGDIRQAQLPDSFEVDYVRVYDLIEKSPLNSGDWLPRWRAQNKTWRGVHVMVGNSNAAADLTAELPALAALGINAVVLEIDYNFAFESHPELRNSGGLTRDEAARLARACREHGIRPIPQFNCLGHQSWGKHTSPLLEKYPELDETPGQYPENQGIYCRSWCPQNPKVNEIVFPLLDELIAAFQADAVHVGMDEVFLVASPHCPRCKNGIPAKLFAKAVNDLHRHLVEEKKVEMLMWADRLLDSAVMGYGPWESAANGTHLAVDLIPKDIILCDWHYEDLTKYPGKPAEYRSIPFFLEKGFRIWPGGWKNVQATEALLGTERKYQQDRLLGHLCTTWGAVKMRELAEWPPIRVATGK